MFKNKVLKILTVMFLSILFLVIFQNASEASTLSVTTSKSSVSPGESFSVTVSVSGGAGYVNLSASNATISSTKLDLMLQSSVTVKCTAGSSGTVTIYASGVIADYVTESDENKSASRSVTIIEPTPTVKDPEVNNKPAKQPGTTTSRPITTTPKEETKKSSDSTLSELSITEGTITPEFNKDVKEYAVIIPYEISEVNVTATPADSKAKVAIEGNKDLIEGENIVKVLVTAEDGTSTTYTIKVTRARIPLALNSLIIKYENKEGQIIEIPLNPAFDFATLEYTLQDLEYWVEKLLIEAVANIEGATIDIQGAENLQIGENTITITVKILEENTPEGEEPKEEIVTYTIKVNKTEEPTLFAKIKDWFKGFMGTVGTWFNNNQQKIILGSIAFCIIALIGLSIYIVIDYNKYKDVIAKVKKVSEINVSSNVIEEIAQQSSVIEDANTEENDKNEKPKGGKHF